MTTLRRVYRRLLAWLAFGPDVCHQHQDFDDPIDEYRQVER